MDQVFHSKDDHTINIMVIGVGYHARRIYVPFFIEEQGKYNTKLVCGYDLLNQKDIIEQYLSKKNFEEMNMYYTDNYEESETLDIQTEEQLNSIISQHNIHGVIISTEPLAHLKYAKWALSKGLHILMDKPMTTERNVSTDISKAKKLLDDYYVLRDLYADSLSKNKGKVVFNLMAQRRYHPAYKLIKHLISEVANKTNCPVTGIQSLHSDGQWRMPSEIVDQDYHPYNQGYGKCSHSGYHSIDTVSWLMEAGCTSSDKKVDNVDVFSNFVRPLDFLTQLNLGDYEKLFPDFHEHNKYAHEQYQSLMSDFGEIDAFTSLSFKQGDKTMCLASINLLHNGFSQRNWISAHGRDLYKGNGRIRQESHYVTQGPFQSISLIAYQSREIKPSDNQGIYDMGGEYHLDIHVFRNSALFPEWKAYECFSVKDLSDNKMQGYSRGHQEDARRNGIVDYIENIKNFEPIETQESNYMNHERGIIILSGIYQSVIAKQSGDNPVINLAY